MHPIDTTLVTELYQLGAIQFGEFTLKSGQLSPIYLNLRKIVSYPTLLRRVANKMWESANTQQFDLICGVPYTALPIATCLSLDHNIPMIIRRKEKKDYGTKQMIEGEFKPGQRCLIIEDVITTGSSILETAKELEDVGLVIAQVLTFIDREQGGKDNLPSNYALHTSLSLSSILHTLLDSALLSDAEKTIVQTLLLNRVS